MTRLPRRGLIAFLVTVLLVLSTHLGWAQDTPIYDYNDTSHPVIGTNGMVASQEALATQAGLAILQSGGNAIDAAVTVGFALAVTLPRAGNLGGGGFMLVHVAESGETIALDYRETAPQAATRDMFLDETGEVDRARAWFSHLAAGVPGTVAGLTLALERYGTMSLAEVLQPAIALAENGFPVSQDLHETLVQGQTRFAAATQQVFFHPDGTPYAVGEILKQPDLARSLRLIAEQGPAAFYAGEIADAIAAEMAANGGLITRADLAAYRPVVREPVRGTYRGYEIASMPPPSSGGVHLIQMLNLLEPHAIAAMGHNTANTVHLLTEVMKRAYADRAEYLGDPDFVEVPTAALISKTYAEQLQAQLNRSVVTPSRAIRPGDLTRLPPESDETTHFSVVDRAGNAVSNTYTLNFSYGSGIMVPGTGILLNNEMDDFAAKPGVPNAYGLIGGERNAIAPGKRMLSSMTPTIVFKAGEVFLVTGSPGGSRIITTVLQILLNVIDHGMNIAEATAAVRVHHQWLPDELRIEQGFNADTAAILRLRGHNLIEQAAMGSTQSILRTAHHWSGASDPRKPGALTVGF